ncbi:GNAT family N-acetyltransferase [Pseudomonas sp. KU43P]|uniref:GNAT family N-acetyltransferase n=1 Tax=Pseudomonas sp. KU43P TaxID=2487887 RepID=UPI0012A7D4CA|nr:GNAT family N-acetyltransferase [Pseudomonas sp. KU43P]BBH46154.1 acetyltransferase [Pseudomonas sp. KU43P]
MLVRPARHEDVPQLMAIERSAARAFAQRPERAWLAQGEVLAVDAHRMFIETACSWVAENAQGELLGFICARLEGRALHIEELSVRLEAQGQGVGRRLLDEAVAVARRRCLQQLTLTTFADVPWNAPFYARYGFELMASEQLSPRLSAVLASERAHGLEGRCAMRLVLA